MLEKIFGSSNSRSQNSQNRPNRPISIANAASPPKFNVLFELVIKKAATSLSAENTQSDNRKFVINVSEVNEATFENVLKKANQKSSFLKLESCEVWLEQFLEYVDYEGTPSLL